VRVVAATNQPLRQRVEEGGFRADLYYRLSVLSIYLPPLRDRRSDIPLLVRRFIKEFSAQHDRQFHGISADAMQLLVDYTWPGNVRELRNLVESMVVLAHGHEIQPADIPREIREGAGARLLPVHIGPVVRGTEAAGGRELEFILRSLVELKLQVEELRRRIPSGDEQVRVFGNGKTAPSIAPSGDWLGEVQPTSESTTPARAIEGMTSAPQHPTISLAPGMTMADIERAAIEASLKHTRGNRRKAAEMLGIGERTMYRKLREYEIPIDSIELE
jgi:DNA-binding NtrC family response regulator